MRKETGGGKEKVPKGMRAICSSPRGAVLLLISPDQRASPIQNGTFCLFSHLIARGH